MLLGITGFEIRYQLRNPVFWVAVAIFFLMGFGISASENVSVGTPGGVHENAPNALAVTTAVFSLFYVFVVTAFVANAIIRDDASGFAPIVRTTRVTSNQILIGRFVGGLIVAWLGYLALPVGVWAGSIMPWVDPERIGPQAISYYAWPFLIFAIPNIFLICAVLFAVATLLRSMMAAYVGAITLVMGYLITSNVVGQKPEYREAAARWEPLGTGALSQTTRYWTQSELNSRLLDLSGALLFNRIFAVLLGFGFLALILWRFSLTERAPSKRKLRRLAKRQAREEAVAAVPAATGGNDILVRDSKPSRATQFMTRLRVEVRQVLTSPGLIVLTLLAVGFTGLVLWVARSTYGTPDHPTVAATITGVTGGSTLFLIMIAAFYGGELVWRERDRKVNELIDSTAVPGWVMTVPKMIAIFLVLLIVNVAAALTGIVYEVVQGARTIGVPQYIGWFIIPGAINGLLIAILAVFLQILSPNKYVGWGLLFVWFVAGVFLSNMGYGNPLYNYAGSPNVPLSDFVGQGSFWIGQAVFLFYWLCFAA
ncbi:MAG: aminopeptidase, partial [Sphingomonas sp.]|nr:aminopeptidase [Sphingomonas sp.]